ncbi:MAG: hypothetical protein L6Q95_17640 [Planctomycetes bacterium]|nr:hypothetical protein [Planctomycetota bacterium]
MDGEKRATQDAGETGGRLDRRERFILRGADDLPEPVPVEPEPVFDIETVLRRLSPRRRRSRRPAGL